MDTFTFTDALLMAIESTKYLYILMCLLQAGFLILFISLYKDYKSSMAVTATARKTARAFRFMASGLCVVCMFTILLLEEDGVDTLAAEVIRNSILVDIGMNLMEYACVKQEKRFGAEMEKEDQGA